MSQIKIIESLSEIDPAVLVWQEAYIEAGLTVPATVETIAKNVGTVLLGDQAA